MKPETKDRIYTLFTVVIVVLLLVGGLVKAAPLYRKYLMLKDKEAERDARIREVEQRTAELNNLIINFGTTDESVESAARAELRYPPDETIFVFHGVEGRFENVISILCVCYFQFRTGKVARGRNEIRIFALPHASVCVAF